MLSFASTFADEITGTYTITSSLFGDIQRVNFIYTTVDLDGETPIELSGAIFLPKSVWQQHKKAPGFALCSHYTVTSNAESAGSIQSDLELEPFVAGSGFIAIASDGRGFGETRDKQQSYLLGRTTARNNIDAFIAGRKLLKENYNYEVGSLIVTVGYSQGGHSTMWINRLVSEGYRGDELPRIDYTLSGGGPYDTVSMYKEMLKSGESTYPVALMLIFDGLIAEGKCGITEEDVYLPELQKYIPEWITSKKYTTHEINDMIYEKFNNGTTGSIKLSKLVQPACLDTTSNVMQRVLPRLKANALVYDDWAPTKTTEIYFGHSTKDEIVPYLNWQSLERHLKEVGYTSYSVGSYGAWGHEGTGKTFAMDVRSLLADYASSHASGAKEDTEANSIQTTVDDNNFANNRKVYRLDGTEVTNTEHLAPGIYIMNHKKFVVR